MEHLRVATYEIKTGNFQEVAEKARHGMLKTFKEHGVHVLGSFIFGLPSDRPDTFTATATLRPA